MKILLRPGAQMRAFFFPCTCRPVNNHLSLVTVCALLVSSGNIFAQGDLTPPGAPAPTMKTLDQIEPRTLINQASLPFTINASGSYYVAENLSVASGNAITINASGVTLDLNGFTITSTSATAAGNAVQLNPGVHDISILNGHIVGGITYNGTSFSAGPGFQHGINATGANPGNVRASGISVTGCALNGINLGSEFSTVVDHCTVRVVGGVGILAGVVSDSTAYQCGDNGIAAGTVTGCYASTTANARGIYTLTAVNCWGVSVSGVGVEATSASACYGQSSSGFYGLFANAATNCYGSNSGSSGAGLFAYSATNCYGFNSSSGVGLSANTAANCYGKSGSTGLSAFIAIGCAGAGSPPVSATHKYFSGIGPDS